MAAPGAGPDEEAVVVVQEPEDVARELAQRERTALRRSAYGGLGLAVIALVWGWVAGSGIILFDGVFSLAGIVLVSVSFLASHAAGGGPSRRYPFGRHAATPLAVVIQGAALLATMVYGLVDAVSTMLDGGSDGAALNLVGYGAMGAVGAWVLARWVHRSAPRSSLAFAEVVSWRTGSWLSVVIVLGGVVGVVLERTDHTDLARYVDPVLLLVAVVLLCPAPVRLLREGTHELLEGAPAPELEAHIARAVESVRTEFDLPEPEVLRGSKVGRRLYVEVEFLVAPHRWSVDDEDAIRRAFLTRVRDVEGDAALDVWAMLELTTDPELAV